MKIVFCSNGSFSVGDKVILKGGKAKPKTYYIYKGSRYTKVHQHNRKKCIYSRKEAMFVPVSSKEVKKGGTPPQDNAEQCVSAELPFFPPQVMNKITRMAETNQSFAASMRMYFSLNMRENMHQHADFMADYIVQTLVSSFSEYCPHLLIKTEYFDIEWPNSNNNSNHSWGTKHEYRQYIFKIDNKSAGVNCEELKWNQEGFHTTNQEQVSQYSVIQDLPDNPVVKSLVEYAKKWNAEKLPGRLICSSRFYMADDYSQDQALSDKMAVFTNQGNIALTKKLLEYIENSGFVQIIKNEFNTSQVSDPYDKAGNQQIIDTVEGIMNDAKKALRNTNIRNAKNLGKVIMDLDKLIRAISWYNRDPSSLDDIYEILYDIPDETPSYD